MRELGGVKMIRRKNRGFSLLESLVTLVVLSIGLLGVTSLQLTTISKGRASFERNQATLLANELIERVRANLPAAVEGHYDLDKGSASQYGAPLCRGSGVNCSMSDLAASDVADWMRRVNSQLRDATVEVDVNVNAGIANSITVTLVWGTNEMNLVAELF